MFWQLSDRGFVTDSILLLHLPLMATLQLKRTALSHALLRVCGDELGDLIAKLNRFVDWNQVTATLDKPELGVWNTYDNFALMLLNGVGLIQFTSNCQSWDVDL